jgi:hypothetical protein
VNEAGLSQLRNARRLRFQSGDSLTKVCPRASGAGGLRIGDMAPYGGRPMTTSPPAILDRALRLAGGRIASLEIR